MPLTGINIKTKSLAGKQETGKSRQGSDSADDLFSINPGTPCFKHRISEVTWEKFEITLCDTQELKCSSQLYLVYIPF